MLDPILSLSFSMHANPKVYALLLGSGLSRAAGIPTGWEVVLELVEKLAQCQGESTQGNPGLWYQNKYLVSPNYSDLLEKLALKPSERRGLLKSYFEPNERDLEDGLKQPTKAHQTIAKLVSQGFVRVILTTNFDPLIEQALAAEGIVPTVIATPDAIQGALPLIHSQCTIIKLNGDYRDARIRNTETELAKYPTPLKKLLNRVLDEFGLIISGWSGEWDIALRDALYRRSNRRYSTYWTVKDSLSPSAEDLSQHLGAVHIPIESADKFFTQVFEKVQSLSEFDRPHPLSTKTAVATVKRYLGKDEYRIQLEDLIREETERTVASLSKIRTHAKTAELGEVLKQVEASVETLLQMLVTGCFYGQPKQAFIWAHSLQRLVETTDGKGQNLYPAFYLGYALGVACVARSQYQTLKQLLEIEVEGHQKKVPVLAEHPNRIILIDELRKVLNNNYLFPMSVYLSERLDQLFSELIPGNQQFKKVFDKYEYLKSFYAFNKRLHGDRGLTGTFWNAARWDGDMDENHISAVIRKEIQSQETDWEPLFGPLEKRQLLELQQRFNEAWMKSAKEIH